MKNVARQAREEPATCPAKTDFINKAEMPVNHTNQRDLGEMIPLLVGSIPPWPTRGRRHHANRVTRERT